MIASRSKAFMVHIEECPGRLRGWAFAAWASIFSSSVWYPFEAALTFPESWKSLMALSELAIENRRAEKAANFMVTALFHGSSRGAIVLQDLWEKWERWRKKGRQKTISRHVTCVNLSGYPLVHKIAKPFRLSVLILIDYLLFAGETSNIAVDDGLWVMNLKRFWGESLGDDKNSWGFVGPRLSPISSTSSWNSKDAANLIACICTIRKLCRDSRVFWRLIF